jgi:hypothetical protein
MPGSKKMTPYNADHHSGVVAYEVGGDYIKAEFQDGRIYLYDYDKPGKVHVDNMIRLARKESGLTSYINQHVRENFHKKLK